MSRRPLEKFSILFTDLYELTMAYGYWKKGWSERGAIFYLCFRKEPFSGGYALASGLESVIEFLENFQFSSSDIAYLSSLTDSQKKPLFEEAFLSFLQKMKLSLDIDAVEEGELVFPQEPLIRVKGSILQAQIIESFLLNTLNFETLIATKASRICFAAKQDEVVEFGMRRAQGYSGAIQASRASFIGGCRSTSNVLAGKIFSIPVKGTMAHSWVLSFETEEEAFLYFAEVFPGSVFFLVDTFDTKKGIETAIRAALFLQKKGVPLLGIRLDSGDLLELSLYAKKRLEQEGLSQVMIMASNELNEYKIEELKKKGAPISIWGVGTHLVTAKDQPSLEGVYKLSSIEDKKGIWKSKFKLSEEMGKSTYPGELQVKREFHNERMVKDYLFDEKEPLSSKIQGTSLLVPIYRKGKLVYKRPSLAQVQEKARKKLEALPENFRILSPEKPYPVEVAKSLQEKREKKKKELFL